MNKPGKRHKRFIMNSAQTENGGGGADPTRNAIEKIAARREARRKAAENYRKKREEEFKQNERLGKPGDVDFQRMIEDWRAKNGGQAEPVSVCVLNLMGNRL